MMTIDSAKQAAGKAAAALIQDGMRVGLGSGSTAAHFIDSLILRCRQGLQISAVATSALSEKQARAGGIPFLDVNAITSLDVTVDGADEIDALKRMIKGGGGALLREKIVASMSREMIVIVDESKLVARLGKFPLPVEIVPFGQAATIDKIQRLGYQGKLRRCPDHEIYRTDNGNLIFDINLTHPLDDPEHVQLQLKSVPGVVETGIFCNLAGRVVIGYADGHAEIKS